MSKILVTGGLGLIGSNICRKLIERGYEVMTFDAEECYSPALKNNYSKYIDMRFEGIKDKIKIRKGSTVNKDDLRKVMKEFEPERVVHLAGVPVAVSKPEDVEQAVAGNCLGTANLLTVIRENGGVKRFVYTSTSSVYGDFVTEKPTEEHPTAPVNEYGATKLLGEQLTRFAGRRDNLDFVIIRPASVYGPTDLNRRVIQIFVENAIKGKSIRLNNNGEERLDFTYVEDTAEGFVLATLEPKARNETFNITYGESRSLRDLSDILKYHFPDLKVDVVPEEADVKRPKRGTLDNSKARRILGFNPKYNLEKGLEKYITFSISDLKERESGSA